MKGYFEIVQTLRLKRGFEDFFAQELSIHAGISKAW